MDTKRIAVATSDRKHISKHLGRCKYFAIYTISPESVQDKQIIENKFTHHRQQEIKLGAPIQGEFPHKGEKHGHHHHNHSHKGLIDAIADCQVVLAGGMGQRLMNDLREAGISAYVVDDDAEIDVIIDKYIKGELQVLKDFKCGGHEHEA